MKQNNLTDAPYSLTLPVKESLFFLLLLSFLTAIFVLKSLSTELFMNGSDEARHAMNGVFYLDFFKDGGWTHPWEYLKQYYAQYPSLSIHLAQPLFPLWEAAIFAIFGISLFSAKLGVAMLGLLTLSGLYYLTRKHLNVTTAILTTLLLGTNFYFLRYFTYVMQEVPALCYLIILSVLALSQSRSLQYWALVLTALAPLAVSHKLLFLYPSVITFYFIRNQSNIVHSIRTFVMIFMLIYLSAFVIHHIPLPEMLKNAFHQKLFKNITDWQWILQGGNASYYASTLWNILSPFGLLLTLCALAVSLKEKQFLKNPLLKYAFLLIVWNFVFYSFFGSLRIRRLMIYSLPFTALAMGWLLSRILSHKSVILKCVSIGSILFLCGFNVHHFLSSSNHLTGYEGAAEYLVQRNDTKSPILFDGYRDGNFVFYLRSLDPEKSQRVYRSDKLMFPSKFNGGSHNFKPMPRPENVRNHQDLFEMMDKYKIRYIVSESSDFNLPMRHKFKEMIESNSAFKKLKEFPIMLPPQRAKSKRGWHNDGDQKLMIYEYLDYPQNNKTSVKIPIDTLSLHADIRNK